MFTRSKKIAWVLAAIVATIPLSGCGSSDPAASPEEVAFQASVQDAIDNARAGGAGEEQLLMLERAKESGTVPIDDARTAARGAVACMEDAGLVAEYFEETTEAGILLPTYSVQVPDIDTVIDELISECENRESFWVNMLYQTQPISTSVTDAYNAERMPYLIACLKENGVAVDDEATRVELFKAATQLWEDTEWETNCVQEAGMGSG